MNCFLWWIKCALLLSILTVAGCKGCFDALIKKSRDDLLLSQRIVEGKLPNGIKYHYLSNSSPTGRCYLRLNVAVGSFNEEEDDLGVAHLIEHLAFDDRLVSKDEHLTEWLQKHGMSFGPDANAYTTAENTIYKLDLPSCDEEALRDGLLIFKSFAQGLQFTDEAIAKEKNIIDAEEREYNNTQGQLSLRLIEHLYSGSSYALRPVLGKSLTRNALTKDAIKAFYDRWYQPQNMAIVLVGDFDPVRPAELIKQIFSDVVKRADSLAKKKLSHPDHKTPIFVLHEPSIPYVETVFNIQSKKITSTRFNKSLIKDRLAFELALLMLKTSLSSWAKEKPDIISEPRIDGFMADDGVFELSLVTTAQEEALEGNFLQAYLTLRRGAELGFSEDEFINAQRSLTESLAQAVVEQATWTSDIWAERIVGHINKKQFAYDMAEFHGLANPILDSITAKDCQRVLKEAMKSGHHYFFAAGSMAENEASLTRLTDLLKNAQRKTLEIKQAQESVSFRYHIEKCPNYKPAQSKMLGDLEATKVRFDNNVQAVFKPASLTNDEIVLNMVMGDGYGVMDQKDYAIASMLHLVFSQDGLGKHPPHEIPLLLRDKIFSLSLQVLERRIQATITTRKKDLRFVLELVRAYLTDPLYAENTLLRSKEKIKAYYAQLPFNMDAPLQHDFLRTLTNNDFRVGRPALDEFLQLTREDFLAWHKKYLESLAITMVMAGDFDQKIAEEDVLCVFGTLPKRPARPKKSPAPISFKPGVEQIYAIKSNDKSSRLLLRYPLSFPKVFPNPKLSLLRDIIHEQLRLKLREKKQTVYDTRISVVDGNEPFLQNWLDIYLAVDKAKVKDTKDKIIRVLNKLAQQGIGQKELTKAKEPLLAQVTQSKGTNRYWADIMMNSFATIDTLKWIVSINEDIKKITTKDINELLREFFTSKNVSTAIVNAVDG